MLIQIDTREQQPYEFASVTSDIEFRTAQAGLPSGDYLTRRGFGVAPSESVASAVKACAVVERKSLQDLYGSLGGGRERFQKEVIRLAAYGYAALVIEADWPMTFAPNDHLTHRTKLSPKSVFATLLAWSQRYDLHVFMCSNRPIAELVTFRILERWIRDDKTAETAKAQRLF